MKSAATDRSAPKITRRRRVTERSSPPILPVLALAASLTACGEPTPDAADGPDAMTATTPARVELGEEALANASIETAEAEPASIRETVVSYGEVRPDPDRVASVVSRVDGILVSASRQLGDTVAAGDVLAVIESRTLASQIVAYLETESEMRFARGELARERDLFGKKLTSTEAVQQKEAAFQKAVIAHAAALQPLEVLHFTEGQLHGFLDDPDGANLTRLEVTSPIDGVVTARAGHPGEAVPADRELFRISDLSKVHVDFHVPLQAAGHLEPGRTASVNFASGDLEAEAGIIFVSPEADQESRTVLVRASLPNPAGLWRPGMPVTVRCDLGGDEAAVTVPSPALLDFEGGALVFVRTGPGSFEARTVEPGRRDQDRVEILSGVAPGETVAAANAWLLKAQLVMHGESEG